MTPEVKEYTWSEMLGETGIYQPANKGYESIRFVVEVDTDEHGYTEVKTFHILHLWDGRWLICNMPITHGWYKPESRFVKKNEEIQLVKT